MKFACMSCAAKYSVPDGRLAAAGPAGLRVRCSRCRAIMVVAVDATHLAGTAAAHEARAMRAAAEDEETRKELRARRPSARPAAGLALASSDASASDAFASGSFASGAPAALSASGVYRPLPGVNRQVTGLFFPEVEQHQAEGKPASSRVWYAAIDSRPRGPFSATEMMSLAERGKIRDATLVWRPGFSAWAKVRQGEAIAGEDLSWLRKVVLARKLREIDTLESVGASAGPGAAPAVMLTRTKAGGKKAKYAGGGASMPPALPDDTDDDMRREISLPDATLREPSAWRATDLPAIAKAQGTRRRRTPLVVTALVAGALAVATVAAVASALAATGVADGAERVPDAITRLVR